MPLVVPDSQPVALADLRARLNKSLTVDDAELQQMLDAAVAEYEKRVGPLAAQTFTERVRDGIFPHWPVLSVASAEYVGGGAVDLTDLDSDALAIGVLKDIYGRGYGSVTVTYTAGHETVPADVREAILADVAGYFATTQRGTGGPGPGPASGYYDAEAGASVPLELFPRIKALAGPVIA